VHAWDVFSSFFFWYATTPNDTSHGSNPHIEPAILTQYVSIWAVLGSSEGLCAELCSSGGFYYEGYTTEDVVECCADYVKDGKQIGLSIPLHEGRLRGREWMGQKTFVDRDYTLVSEAHFSVLQQLVIAGSYIDEHLSELWRDNTYRTYSWIMKEHRRVFTTWLMEKDIPIERYDDEDIGFSPIKLCDIMAIIWH
jgi:hypothetical protein